MISRINSTAIDVSWDRQTLVELKGLAEYVIEYSQVSKRRQSGNTITIPWTENNVIISKLMPGIEYSVTVSASTSVGMSGNDIVIQSSCHCRYTFISDPAAASPPSSEAGTKYVAIIAGVVLGSVLAIAIIAGTITFVLRYCRGNFKPKPDRLSCYSCFNL